MSSVGLVGDVMHGWIRAVGCWVIGYGMNRSEWVDKLISTCVISLVINSAISFRGRNLRLGGN